MQQHETKPLKGQSRKTSRCEPKMQYVDFGLNDDASYRHVRKGEEEVVLFEMCHTPNFGLDGADLNFFGWAHAGWAHLTSVMLLFITPCSGLC